MKLKIILFVIAFFFSLCTLSGQAKLNAVCVEVSVGELLDKISILEIKKIKIEDPEKNKNVRLELELLEKEYDKLPNQEEKMKFIKQLFLVNSVLWELEDKVREKESKQLFDENFIQIARDIYLNNDKRYHLKQQVNLFFKSKIIEEKSYLKDNNSR